MSNFDNAKAYAYSLRHEGLRQTEIIKITMAKFNLRAEQRNALQAYLKRKGVGPYGDRSMSGTASLKALTLPLNRIAEAFV